MGKMLLKVVVFFIIITYFLFYEYNQTSTSIKQNDVTHISTLLLQEQKLLNQLNINNKEILTQTVIEQYDIPYIEGTLIESYQLDEHIVVAKVQVSHVYKLNIEEDDTILVAYTVSKIDESHPKINNTYKWLIQQRNPKDAYFYLQGGLQGIIPLK